VNGKFAQGIAKFYVAFPKRDAAWVVRDMKIGASADGTLGEFCVCLI
jgi:hypothetical protein